MLKPVIQFDRSLFYYINNKWSNDFFDAVMPFMRNQYFWVPVYLFLLVFVITNFRTKAWWWILFFLATFALTDMISTQVFKAFFERPRPCADAITSQSVRMLIPCSYSYGFVSSHAANHFGIAMFLFGTMKQFSKSWIWLVFTYSKYPFDFKYKVTNAIVVIPLTKKLAKTYHPNNVENQCTSIDIIQSHEDVELNTAKRTRKVAPLR